MKSIAEIITYCTASTADFSGEKKALVAVKMGLLGLSSLSRKKKKGLKMNKQKLMVLLDKHRCNGNGQEEKRGPNI